MVFLLEKLKVFLADFGQGHKKENVAILPKRGILSKNSERKKPRREPGLWESVVLAGTDQGSDEILAIIFIVGTREQMLQNDV